MGEYTRKEFLEYYDFEDEPEMVPQTFHSKRHLYTNLVKNVEEDVKLGVRIIDAIRLNAGVTMDIVYKWRKAFVKEIEDGKTDTPLIRLFRVGYRSDAGLYRKIMGLALSKAEEGDASIIQYLAKHRLGYNSVKKQEVELSSKEEAPVKFVFKDMTPIEKDSEE